MPILIAILVLVLLVAITGYVMNVKKLIACDKDTDGIVVLLRFIGVVLPLVGAVIGFIS